MKIVKKVLSLIVVILLILLNTNVKAAGLSGNFSVKANSTKVKAGDTIKIDVTLNDLVLEEGTYGITSIKTNVEYNKDIFEAIKKSDIDTGDRDVAVTYVADTGLISIEFRSLDSFVKESGKVFSINLKVKENASFESTEVKFVELKATDNTNRIQDTVSLTFNNADTTNNNQNQNKEQEKQEEQEEQKQEDSNKQEESQNKENKNIEDSTTSKGKLPKTGLNEIIALISIYSVIVLAVMFIRYRQINN